MSRVFNYVTAVAKIGYDKSTDYLGYYTNYSNKNNQDNQDNQDNKDKIDDYDSILEIENYKNRSNNNSKRIFEHIGLLAEYSSFFSNPTLIIDNLYLGSAFNAASYYKLIDLDIKVIINVTKEISLYYPDEFIYKTYDIYDDNLESIYKYLEIAYQDIKDYQKNIDGNILIHCFMGASRSASVVLYYLMKEIKSMDNINLTHEQALKFLKQKRPVVNPTFRLTMDLAKSFIINPNYTNHDLNDLNDQHNESNDINNE